MATDTGSAHGPQGRTSESLLTLAGYLELALDAGSFVVLQRQSKNICAVYIGDPRAAPNDLTRYRTISAALADEILEITNSGENRITLGEQTYRFVRSFA